MLLQVLRVHLEPVLRGVAAGLAVGPHGGPDLLRQATQQRRRVRPHRLDRPERRPERRGVVVEGPGPRVLVVAHDRRARLGREEADSHRRVRLGVGGVADDLVRRPLPLRGSPLPRLGGDPLERRSELRRALLVTPDQGLTLGCFVRHSPSSRAGSGRAVARPASLNDRSGRKKIPGAGERPGAERKNRRASCAVRCGVAASLEARG